MNNGQDNKAMRNSTVGRQIVLPLSKGIEIAWKSIRIRLWRSLITTSGVILAIAFLMSIFTDSAFTNALHGVGEDHPKYHLVQDVLQDQAMVDEDIALHIGILDRDDTEDAPGMEMMESLLVHGNMEPFLFSPDSEEIVAQIQGTQGHLPANLIIILGFPVGTDQTVSNALDNFVQDGGAVLVIGYNQLWPPDVDTTTVRSFADLLPAIITDDVFILDDPDRIEAAPHPIAADVTWTTHPQAGYRVTEGREDSEKIAHTPQGVLAWIAERGHGEILHLPLEDALHAGEETFVWLHRSGILASSIRWMGREELRGSVMGPRTIWLVSLSLLVCIVGITNAMLMSVTERFREIGTMKCLGALDRFVIRLFLIESSFQGAAGALSGVLVGFLLTAVRILFSFRVTDVTTEEVHWLALEFFPGMSLVFWGLVSLLIGMVLSVIAAIYPAYTAARMQPVEAMRVEA